MEQCKKQLEAHLFILHPLLCPALLRVQANCVNNSERQLMAAIEPLTTYTLEEFKTVHVAKMKLVSTMFRMFFLFLTFGQELFTCDGHFHMHVPHTVKQQTV